MERKITIEIEPTDTELKLVKLLAEGVTGGKMAKKMNIEPYKLAADLSAIRIKYNCKNSTHLVAYFLRNKLID